MMQLADGRLAVRTPKDINLYDGRRFSLISLPAEKAECITKYKGQTLDAGKRLLKKKRKVVISTKETTTYSCIILVLIL